MPRILYEVTVDVSPSAEASWDAWHSSRHVPELLHQPGFVGARKLREAEPLADGWIRYVTQYEVADANALNSYLQSEAGRRIREDHARHYGEVTRVSRRTLHDVRSF